MLPVGSFFEQGLTKNKFKMSTDHLFYEKHLVHFLTSLPVYALYLCVKIQMFDLIHVNSANIRIALQALQY
jgi:hypothetical protein